MVLEKFEIKVNEIKKALGEKKLSVIFFSIFGITILMCLQMANVYGRSRQTNSDSYNRTFFNMLSNIKNAEVFVEKARVTSTKKQQIVTMVQVLKHVNLSKEALSNLPVNQDDMNNISKFLTQTGDFSQYAIKKLSEKELEEKDYELLKSINESLVTITNTLDDIYSKLQLGRIDWNDVQKIANEELKEGENILLDGISTIKNEFMEYEGLIYDGAYSSHIEKSSPKYIENMPEITVTEAKQKVIDYVKKSDVKNQNVEIYDVKYNGKIEGSIALYSFDVTPKNENSSISVQVTAKGGLLYLMVYDRKVENKNIDENEAKEMGEKYLKSIGIENIKPTYTIEQNGMITINYAHEEQNTTIYTDLIKVKIAMDNGKICSVESKGYIFNNHERGNFVPVITLEDAKGKLNNTIEVKSSTLAIIPNDLNEEVLTYEFKGIIEKREYIIYINATSGEEEQVLVILDTKGGKLTM